MINSAFSIFVGYQSSRASHPFDDNTDQKLEKVYDRQRTIDQHEPDLEQQRGNLQVTVNNKVHIDSENSALTEHGRQDCDTEAKEDRERSLSKLPILDTEVSNKHCGKQTSKCLILKKHQAVNDSVSEVLRIVDRIKIQPVLKKFKFIEKQWDSLQLLKVVKLLNPNIIKFDSKKSLEDMSTSGTDVNMTFRRSIILCYRFHELMKIRACGAIDKCPFENDIICDIVGHLMAEVEEQDRTSVLDAVQQAMNILMKDNGRENDKLTTRLITNQECYELSTGCLLLEQMILDRKYNNSSWMPIVCTKLIDLCVQDAIETELRGDIIWILKYLLTRKSEWKTIDVYNLIKNCLFRGHPKDFYQYMIRIQNSALSPSTILNSPEDNDKVCLRTILECPDEVKWKLIEADVNTSEAEKTLDRVLEELNIKEVGSSEQDCIRDMIKNSIEIRDKYKMNFREGISQELERFHSTESEACFDESILTSCLAVTSMALYTNKTFWPSNTQLVSCCLLINRREKSKGRLLEISTGEGKSCVIAMVAATYALLKLKVDVVTSSTLLSQRDAETFCSFYKSLGLSAGVQAQIRM